MFIPEKKIVGRSDVGRWNPLGAGVKKTDTSEVDSGRVRIGRTTYEPEPPYTGPDVTKSGRALNPGGESKKSGGRAGGVWSKTPDNSKHDGHGERNA